MIPHPRAEPVTAGEEFDAICEEIVQAVNGLQVRRRSFEEIDPEDRGRLIGDLRFWRDQLLKRIAEIDAELSKILDARAQ